MLIQLIWGACFVVSVRSLTSMEPSLAAERHLRCLFAAVRHASATAASVDLAWLSKPWSPHRLDATGAVGLAIDNLGKPITTHPETRDFWESNSDRRDQNPRYRTFGLRPVAGVVGWLQCLLQAGWSQRPAYGSNQDNLGSILRSLRTGSLPCCRSCWSACWSSALRFSSQHNNAWANLLSARSLH